MFRLRFSPGAGEAAESGADARLAKPAIVRKLRLYRPHVPRVKRCSAVAPTFLLRSRLVLRDNEATKIRASS
jgi:hypothetical protein